MEEQVGQFWDRFITRRTHGRHPDAAVELPAMLRTVGILFRSAGGDSGLEIKGVPDQPHHSHRGFWQKVAGQGSTVPWAWSDATALYLPARLDLFPEERLNRDLYRWLAVLMGRTGGAAPESLADWFQSSRRAAREVLEAMPGLVARYDGLVRAHLAQRPAGTDRDRDAAEATLRHALRHPDAALPAPPGLERLMPVPLWPHPRPPLRTAAGPPVGELDDGGAGVRRQRDAAEPTVRKPGERTCQEERPDGLLACRFDAIFSWAELLRVNRPSEDEDDDRTARRAARELDQLTVSRQGRAPSRAIRFDLDLPPAAMDDTPVGPGIRLPEWDYRTARLMPDHCLVYPMVPTRAAPAPLPAELRAAARRVRSLIANWQPDGVWVRRRLEGMELDLDACLERIADRSLGRGPAEAGVWRDFRRGDRDLACLLLADLSLSTDAWVDDQRRVIDVIRDTLFLFAEALSATGDRFGLYGFSSRRRHHVRYHLLKPFDQPWDDRARGRIGAIKPGFYTRLGAAIRHSADLLAAQPARRRLLLLLTDGKPNDVDHYQGRYGIEDTRMAVREVQRRGIHPFCVTIDDQAGRYGSHLFGSQGYVRIRS
ncbi:MAG: VWA domain-containing protein, partial [Magnetococcales bacterium]|nr:VWA domain-containing protein [Magnetococcales bacterium]